MKELKKKKRIITAQHKTHVLWATSFTRLHIKHKQT